MSDDMNHDAVAANRLARITGVPRGGTGCARPQVLKRGGLRPLGAGGVRAAAGAIQAATFTGWGAARANR